MKQMSNFRTGPTRYEFSADSKQFALLLGVAALFVVVVFFSGVLVGNLVVKRETQTALPQAAGSAGGETGLRPGRVVDKELAGIDEEELLKELNKAAPVAEKEPPSPVKDVPVAQPVPPPAPVAKPKPLPPPPKKVASTRPSALEGSYFSVQVAAFRERPLAERYANRLKGKDYDAYVVEANLSSGMWYRVRVGRYTREGDAQSLHSRLLSRERISGMVVRENP